MYYFYIGYNSTVFYFYFCFKHPALKSYLEDLLYFLSFIQFLELFISLCRSVFRSCFIFLSPEELNFNIGEDNGTPSSTLAWKIPWTEEPGGLQSMGSLRVGHDWVTSLSLSLSCIGEGNGNPLQCSCLENPREGGAWWAAVYGVAQSRTRLKWLSSSSSTSLLVIPSLKFYFSEKNLNFALIYERHFFLEVELCVDSYYLS